MTLDKIRREIKSVAKKKSGVAWSEMNEREKREAVSLWEKRKIEQWRKEGRLDDKGRLKNDPDFIAKPPAFKNGEPLTEAEIRALGRPRGYVKPITKHKFKANRSVTVYKPQT